MPDRLKNADSLRAPIGVFDRGDIETATTTVAPSEWPGARFPRKGASILLFSPPGRTFAPVAHRISSPCSGLVGVACRTWIRDLILIRHRGSNEFECMRVDFRVSRALRFNFRHVAGNALAACASLFVMGMLFEGRGARAVR